MSPGQIFFEFNCRYHSHIFFGNNTDPYSKSYLAKKLAKELKNLIFIYQQNLIYAQKLQKQANDKKVKLQNYAFSKKIWLNSKYIQIK